ncbi:MAG: TolC family protein [Sulfurimonas sp.]|nr:TolC family protein [Sulfurimonas sp.]
MKKLIFLLLFIGSQLYAITLDEIIVKALQKNPSLESINHRISANKSDIDLSNQFSNPTLSYSQNTLDEKEKMSRKTLAIQQKIPYYGKRDSLKYVALVEEEILIEKLNEAKVNLVNEIKNQAYTIWEFQELYKIILNYIDLTKQNIKLFESYTMTSSDQHMGIMSAELTLSDLRIEKSILDSKIAMSYYNLSYLTSFEVKNLYLDLSIKDMKNIDTLAQGLSNNKDILLRDKQIKKTQAMVDVAKINNYPDINLLASYSYRKDYDNYATFGLGINLPIYSSEDYKEERLRKLTLSAQSLKEDTTKAITSKLQATYTQMKSQYDIYHIINDEALPQIQHMFKLSGSSISAGSDLFKYIDILVQKLKLEQKSITAVANFNKADAKISALLGELK